MFLREGVEIESGLEEEKDTKLHLEEDNDVEYPVDGETLVIRRALIVQIKKDEVQQENIFHTKCYVDNKICGMIIDGGSYTNVVIIPRPYKL